MWFRINMDLVNPVMQSHIDELFGDDSWRQQPFMLMQGFSREKGFLQFFCSRLAAKFVFRFKIRYDPEDRTGAGRTKYYILHASNHVEAVLLMKEGMWPLGDEEGTFDYSGESQGVLISSTPTEDQLEQILLHGFKGQELAFEEIRKHTWSLPFVEKHYRAVIKKLEGKEVTVTRVTSKQSGIKGRDRVRFK